MKQWQLLTAQVPNQQLLSPPPFKLAVALTFGAYLLSKSLPKEALHQDPNAPLAVFPKRYRRDASRVPAQVPNVLTFQSGRGVDILIFSLGQEALGLHQDPNAPIVAFIGRLAPQKGIDVIEEVAGPPIF